MHPYTHPHYSQFGIRLWENQERDYSGKSSWPLACLLVPPTTAAAQGLTIKGLGFVEGPELHWGYYNLEKLETGWALAS